MGPMLRSRGAGRQYRAVQSLHLSARGAPSPREATMQHTWMIATALAATTVVGATRRRHKRRRRPNTPGRNRQSDRDHGAEHGGQRLPGQGHGRRPEGSRAGQTGQPEGVERRRQGLRQPHGRGPRQDQRRAGPHRREQRSQAAGRQARAASQADDGERRRVRPRVHGRDGHGPSEHRGAFEKQSREGQDEALKRFVTEKLPTVRITPKRPALCRPRSGCQPPSSPCGRVMHVARPGHGMASPPARPWRATPLRSSREPGTLEGVRPTRRAPTTRRG